MVDQSKLQSPAPPRGLISRGRVDGLLKFASRRPVTVLHAPAGFGKTTAVLNWLRAVEGPVAWLTLDSFDNDPRRLATHLFAALDAAVPGLGTDALRASEGGSDPIETCIPLLAQAVRSVGPSAVVFVLDDFHFLSDDDCQEIIRAFVRAVMRSMRTIITSRTRPPLRLRASDISVITAGELSFQAGEVEQLLNGSYRLDVSEKQLHELESKVRGWPVGLSLLGATLVVQQQSGSEIQIEHHLASLGRGALADYVIQEMLDHLEPETRDFLLKTSILDRLCADLCEAVLEDPNAPRLLEEITARSYVTLELGDGGTWVRSHDLVRSVLEQKLLQEDEELAAGLHRRAAAWHAKRQLPAEAIEHAIAAGDGLFAAEMIASNATALMQSRQYSTLRRALTAAPADRGEYGPLLEALEITLTIWTDGDDYAVARARALDLVARHPDRLDVMRMCDTVLTSAFAGDVDGSVKAARRALERDSDDPALRRQWEVMLGQALWFAGDPTSAAKLIEPHLTVTDPLLVGMYARAFGSLIHAADGELQKAEEMIREALALLQQAGAETSVEFIGVYAAVTEVLRAAGKLSEARAHADRYLTGRELARPGSIGHAIALTLDARVAVAERRRTHATRSAARARALFAEYRDPGQMLIGWLDEVDRALAAPADETMLGTRLTPAELRVLTPLSEGLSRGEIAASLYLSDATVKSHLRRIYRRLGVSNRHDAIAAAHERGLI